MGTETGGGAKDVVSEQAVLRELATAARDARIQLREVDGKLENLVAEMVVREFDAVGLDILSFQIINNVTGQIVVKGEIREASSIEGMDRHSYGGRLAALRTQLLQRNPHWESGGDFEIFQVDHCEANFRIVIAIGALIGDNEQMGRSGAAFGGGGSVDAVHGVDDSVGGGVDASEGRPWTTGEPAGDELAGASVHVMARVAVALDYALKSLRGRELTAERRREAYKPGDVLYGPYAPADPMGRVADGLQVALEDIGDDRSADEIVAEVLGGGENE